MVTAPTVQPSKDLIVHAPTTRFFQILNPIDITICTLVARQHVDSTWTTFDGNLFTTIKQRWSHVWCGWISTPYLDNVKIPTQEFIPIVCGPQ